MTLIKKVYLMSIGIIMAGSHRLNKINTGTDSLFLVQLFDLYYAFYIDCCVDGALLRH